MCTLIYPERKGASCTNAKARSSWEANRMRVRDVEDMRYSTLQTPKYEVSHDEIFTYIQLAMKFEGSAQLTMVKG